MKIERISSFGINFKAGLKVTTEAKNLLYSSDVHSTVVANLVFNNTMRKFSSMLYGEFPFGREVYFDVISKKTKAQKPGTSSKYELRIFDKSVDFDFNHNRIFIDPKYKNMSIENKIEQESDIQAGYLYDAYAYLKGLFGK